MLRAFINRVIGFVFPSWAVYAVIGALIVGAIGAVYAKGWIDAAHMAEITALKIELDQERDINRKLTEYIARLEKAAKEDAEEKAKDDATIIELQTKLAEFVESVSNPDRECFSADDIDGLLGVWRKGGSGHYQGR